MRPQRGQFYTSNARIMMLGVTNILFSSACFISIEFRHVYIKSGRYIRGVASLPKSPLIGGLFTCHKNPSAPSALSRPRNVLQRLLRFSPKARGFMHVSPTFENFLCTFLPHSDLSHNNRSVISVIGVFLTIIAYILYIGNKTRL